MVRSKIRVALRKPGVTQAAFLRAISASYPDSQRVLPRGLNQFLSKTKPLEGSLSYAYYASYVFFEKVRIRDGKSKTADRKVMEREWPNGVDVELDPSKVGVWVRDDESFRVDKYGKVRIFRCGPWEWMCVVYWGWCIIAGVLVDACTRLSYS